MSACLSLHARICERECNRHKSIVKFNVNIEVIIGVGEAMLGWSAASPDASESGVVYIIRAGHWSVSMPAC